MKIYINILGIIKHMFSFNTSRAYMSIEGILTIYRSNSEKLSEGLFQHQKRSADTTLNSTTYAVPSQPKNFFFEDVLPRVAHSSLNNDARSSTFSKFWQGSTAGCQAVRRVLQNYSMFSYETMRTTDYYTNLLFKIIVCAMVLVIHYVQKLI